MKITTEESKAARKALKAAGLRLNCSKLGSGYFLFIQKKDFSVLSPDIVDRVAKALAPLDFADSQPADTAEGLELECCDALVYAKVARPS